MTLLCTTRTENASTNKQNKSSDKYDALFGLAMLDVKEAGGTPSKFH